MPHAIDFGWPGAGAKPREQFPYSFEGPIVPPGGDGYYHSVIFLPDALAQELDLARRPRLRVEGVIGRATFNGACHSMHGRWFLLVSRKLLPRTGHTVGDIARVEFRVADQSAVDVPEELSQALAKDRKAKIAWEASTPGRRRSLAYVVSSAKTPPTRLKRIESVLAVLRGEIEFRPGKRS